MAKRTEKNSKEAWRQKKRAEAGVLREAQRQALLKKARASSNPEALEAAEKLEDAIANTRTTKEQLQKARKELKRVSQEARDAHAKLSPKLAAQVTPEDIQAEWDVEAKLDPDIRAEVRKRVHARIEEIKGSTDLDADLSVDTPKIIAEVTQELRPEEGTFRLGGRSLTLSEAAALTEKEAARQQFRPQEQEEFHARVLEMFRSAEPAGDGTTDRIVQINFQRIADQVKADLRPKPDVRRYVSTKRSTPEEQTVECFLECMGYALHFSRTEPDPDRRAGMLRSYVAFRDARVFHIGQETYIAVHQEADRFTTEMAGLAYDPPLPVPKPVPEKESQQYVHALMRGAQLQEYPDKLPFPVIFLGYGDGAIMSMDVAGRRAPKALRDQLTEIRLIGHLMVDNGLALACFRGFVDDGQTTTGALWCDEVRDPESGWPRGFELEPWILPHLIRILNDHRSFIIETELSRGIKSDIKANRKELGIDDYKHMPKPYYTLRLQSHVVRDKVRKQLGRPPKPKSYKTDVRGHERCRIRRGKLPLDPELAVKLQARGYVIFSTNTLDATTFQRLSERGLGFKRSDEWLAVKATWVKDHMSSLDPKLPYIPAVRVTGKIRTRPKKSTGGWVDDPAAH